MAGELRQVLRGEAAIIGASLGPLAVILLTRAAGASEHTSVQAGQYSIILLLAHGR